jgi:hypothetical protein
VVSESTGAAEDLVQNEGPVMSECDFGRIARITRGIYAAINTFEGIPS